MTRPRTALQALSRIDKARHELEVGITELHRAIAGGEPAPAALLVHHLHGAARALELDLAALRRLVDSLPPDEVGRRSAALVAQLGDPGSAISALLAARLLQQQRAQEESKAPSLAARVLAALLDTPGELDAATVAERISCTEAVARTTLHRLVASGNAERTGTGRFCAKR